MRRVAVIVSLLLFFGTVLALWLGEIRIEGARRAAVQDLLHRVLGVRVGFHSLALRFAPLALRVRDLSIGDQGAFEIESVHVQLLALASVREGRPVVAASVDGPRIDLTQIPEDEEEESGVEATPEVGAADPFDGIPPLRVSKLLVRGMHLRFTMGDEDPVDVLVDAVELSLLRPFLRHVLEGSLDVRSAQWQRKQFGFRVDRIAAAGGADSEGVWVERTEIEGPDIQLRASATADRHRQRAEATFRAAMLGAFVDELAYLGGDIRLAGEAWGNTIDPHVDARLDLKSASFAGHPIGDLSTRFVRTRSRLSFDDIEIQGEPGKVRGSVQLVAFDEVPIQADLTWEKVDLAKLLRAIDPDIPFHCLLDGRTWLSGAFDPLELEIRGQGWAQPMEAERSSYRAQWKANSRILADVFEARADILQEGNEVRSELSIRSSAFAGSARARIENLHALSGLFPEPITRLGLGGRGEATVLFSGDVDDPAFEGSVHLKEASVSGTSLNEVRGPFEIRGAVLRTPELAFATGGGVGTLSGSLAMSENGRNDWKLGLRNVDTNLVSGIASRMLDVTLPIRDGALTAVAGCHGPWESAVLDAEVHGRDVSLVGEKLEELQVKVAAPLPVWQGNARLRHLEGEVLSLQASGKGADTVDLSFSSTPFRLGRLGLLRAPDLLGTGTIQGRIFGPWQATAGEVDLQLARVGDRRRSWGDARLRARGTAGRWEIEALALEERWRTTATLQARKPFAYRLDSAWREADLSPLFFDPSGPMLRLSGELHLDGNLADMAQPSGNARISQFLLIRDPHIVRESGPFLFDIGRGKVAIREMSLRYEGGQLAVAGELSTDGAMRLQAAGEGDLLLLELFDLPLVAARGPFSLRASAAFAPEAGWRLEGEARLRDGTLDFGLPVAFTRVQGEIALHGDEIQVQRLEGRAGGGHFSLGGQVNVGDGPRLTWSARDVSFSPVDRLEIKASGEGKLAGAWERLLLDGSVEITHALYDRGFDWTDVLPWLLEQVSGRKLPPVKNLERPVGLDLIVYSRGGVFVDNNLANLEAWLDLLIGGDTSQPIVSGRIGFLNGEVFLRGRKFSISGGSVDFRDYYRNDPILNITAEGRVVSSDNDYGLTMLVSGSASNPRIQFSSTDPTLSQSDVFNLATFGKTSAQLQREGSGISAADALALVPTGEVEKRVGALVGIDRFEVEAVQSRSSGAMEPRVTIGKDLTDRIRALAWTSFGVESRRAVQLEYRVSRTVSLLGSWESDAGSQAGAFGGDVKFRYEFRKVPFSLLNPYRYFER